MRLNLLTLALAIFIVSTASAQKFSPGYYINSSGDTIRKDISLQMKKDYIEKIVTPEGLYLAPKDILGFGQNQVNYVVRKVSMDKTPDNGFVTDTVFLEVMNRGKISLYYMMDENDKVHFYIENENGPQELTVRLNDKNDGIAVRKIETYRSALKGIFPSCTDLFPEIDKTIFGRKPIQVIYEKLYKCRYEEAPPEMKKEESVRTMELGVYGGVLMASNDFTIVNTPSANVALLYTAKFPGKSIQPTGGVFFEMKFARRKTFALRQELSYMGYQQTSDAFKLNNFSSTTYSAKIAVSYVRYTFSLRGYFLRNTSSIRPFVSVGGSVLAPLSKTHTVKRRDDNTGEVTVEPIFKKTTGIMFNYFAGVGIAYKNFAFEFRREMLNGFSDRHELHWKVTPYSFTLHYTLKTFSKG